MSYFIRHNMLIMSGVFLAMMRAFYQASLAPSGLEISFLLEGMLFLKSVLIYVAALEILKGALILRRVFSELRYQPGDYSNRQTWLLAMVSAFPFGLGVSSFLKGLANERIDTKPISEGMTTSILTYPTTLASGFVFDSLEMSSPLVAVFLFGLPVVVAVLLPWRAGSIRELIKSRLFLMT